MAKTGCVEKTLSVLGQQYRSIHSIVVFVTVDAGLKGIA